MEDIIVPIKFENAGLEQLSEAVLQMAGLSEATAEYAELRAELDKQSKNYFERSRKQIEAEREAEKQLTAEKKKKLDVVKNLARTYGGAFGSALAKVIESYQKVREVVSNSIDAFKDQQITLLESTGLTVTYQQAYRGLIDAIQARFPKAVKAFAVAARVIKVALISTGIGAIVALVGLLIGALIGMGSAAGESSKGLSRIQVITIAIKSTLEALSITFKNALQELKNFVNGGQSLFTTLKNIVGLGTGIADTVGKIAQANSKIAQLNKEADKLEGDLAQKIADNTDALNKYNETANDSSKSERERIAAIKAAANIEKQLEADRASALDKRIAAQELEVGKYMEGTEERKAAEQGLRDLKTQFTLEDADNEARKRRDKAAINGLLKEEADRVKALRQEYRDLQKEIQDIIDAQMQQGMNAEEQIRADAERQRQAILNLQKATQAAARAANMPFDITPFKTALENLGKETEKQLKLLGFQNEQAQADLNQKTQEGIIAGLSASFDEQYTLQEAQQIELINLQLETARKTLEIKQKTLAATGELDTAAGQQEIVTLENLIAELNRARLEVDDKAKTRRFNAGMELIDQDLEIATMQLELLEESGDKTLTLEQEINKLRLELQLKAAEQRLAIIIAASGENSPEAKAAQIQIDVLKKQIKSLADTDPIKGFVKELLQINDDELSKIEEQIGSTINNISTVFAIANDQARQRNAELIQSLTDRIEATKQKISEEEEMQRNGYANNLALYKAQLENLEKERDAAAKKAQEREKKQAQAQLAIESAIQVANYITTVTELLKKETKKFGLVGVVTAIAGVALIASIIAKARANAQQFKEPPKFREGGYVSGASHAFGGKKIEVEGGEFVINRNSTAKHIELLEAINSGKFQGVDLQKLISARYNLNPLLQKMNDDRQVIVELQNAINYDRMEQMFSSAHNRSMERVINYLESWPKRMLDTEGNEMVYWKEGMKQRRQIIKKIKEE